MAQTRRFKPFVLVPLVAALVSFTAEAAVVIDTTAGSSSATGGWGGTAQTFTAPAGDNVLQDWTFFLAPRTGGGSVAFSIYDWSGTAPQGAALYTTTLTWNASGGATGVSGINLALTTGDLYGAVVDLLGYTGSSVSYTGDLYAGGNGQWTSSPPSGPYDVFADLDHSFIAVFDGGGTVPEPSSFALLGLGLAGLAAARRRKQ